MEVSTNRRSRTLTIGMATYDDYDGVYFTVQALRLYHPEVTRDVDILVLDNNPSGAASDPLGRLAKAVTSCRYVPDETVKGTSVRDLIFREAETPWVMVIDCHVLLVPGALRLFLDYVAENPESHNLLQGPLVADNLRQVSTHFEPVWNDWMFGQWGTDARGLNPDAEPFEIRLQGLGLFACRREAWLGFNPLFRGFGGEEGYIHEKYRRAGHRTLCLPFLRWIHRFDRPNKIPYPNHVSDRLRNYVIACAELGVDTDAVDDHFRSKLGDEAFSEMRRVIDVELAAEPLVSQGSRYAAP